MAETTFSRICEEEILSVNESSEDEPSLATDSTSLSFPSTSRSSTPPAMSIIEVLRSPQPSEMSRKRKILKNPSKGKRKSK